ncbi:MAG: ABC transporter permease [Trueperaceae bacterium]|nr:MAG: ABC transporter permease [Trueperaceae bacterium]
MSGYIARRVLQIIPVLFGVTLIVFLMIRLKGDPVQQLVPDWYSEEQIQEVRVAYGFDRPIHVQYVSFLSRAVRGDFGRSFHNRQPAWDMIKKAIPRTAQLALAAFVLGVVIAFPLGIISALRRNTILDLAVTGFAVWGRSLPNFWLGIMLILVFAVTLRWFPVSGTGAISGQPFLKHLFLPAFTLSMGLITTLTRLIRSAVLEVIREDYVTTARAKGLRERVTIVRHVLRNALIPVVTVMGLQIAWLMGGSVIIEQVFAWPGMGRLMLQAIYARDNSVVQAGLLVTSLIIMVSNLVVDLLYTVLDPRIRYS